MKLYNTLSGKKEEFVPADGKCARMYSCGPTVYSFAHIGNMRTYIFTDLLRRVIKYNGFKLKGIMNITDVGHLLSDADEGEDKMEMAAKQQKISPYEIASRYTGVFLQDLEKLNISLPELMPKATEHIDEMLEFVQGLCDKGYAYETSDGIYFDISKFSEYGELSGISGDNRKAGARVDVNTEKRNPADFAVWKKAPKEHIMQWDSKWGMGYPGWHIECSAMSKKYLGEVFDIHTGGVDHIPVHHENEIAQSRALTGHNPARFWIHSEFMLVDGGKMSKSLGNTYTVSQLEEKGYTGIEFRYFCLNAHYRKKLNFTFEGMDAAKVSVQRLISQLLKHKAAHGAQSGAADKYTAAFDAAVNDDLNIPEALGILWTMLKEAPDKDIYGAAIEMDKIFGLRLSLAREQEESGDIPERIVKLADERLKARRERDYAKSDELRAKIDDSGFIIADTKDGYSLQKKA